MRRSPVAPLVPVRQSKAFGGVAWRARPSTVRQIIREEVRRLIPKGTPLLSCIACCNAEKRKLSGNTRNGAGGCLMDDGKYEIEVLPATASPDAGRELVVHADLERLRREVAAPPIVREAGPGAEYAYADFFKAKIGNTNTRKAYKRAVDRFLGWCHLRGLELRRVTSFLVGDYLENHLNDKEGRPLSAPSKKQHLAALRHFFDNQQVYHGVVLNPASSVRGPKYSAREGKTPAFHDKQVRDLIDSVDTVDVVGTRDRTLLMVLAYT